MRILSIAVAGLLCAACGPRYVNQTVETSARYGNAATDIYYTLEVDAAGLATRIKTVGSASSQPETRQLAPDSFTTFKRTIVEADPMSLKPSYDPCAAAKCDGTPSSFELKVSIDRQTKTVKTLLVSGAGIPKGLQDMIELFTTLDGTFPMGAS